MDVKTFCDASHHIFSPKGDPIHLHLNFKVPQWAFGPKFLNEILDGVFLGQFDKMEKIVLTERIPDEYEFKEKYDCVCYNCNTEFFFKPSLLMIHGINHGYSIRLKCRTELNLRINLNHDIGISLPLQEFLLKDFLKDDKKDQQ